MYNDVCHTLSLTFPHDTRQCRGRRQQNCVVNVAFSAPLDIHYLSASVEKQCQLTLPIPIFSNVVRSNKVS